MTDIVLAPRKTPIKDAEWKVSIQLEVAGQPVGDVLVLGYGDAYAAKQPANVGYLVARALNEQALLLKGKRG